MLAYNSRTGRAIAYKFSGQLRGAPGIILGAKNLGSWVGAKKFTLFVSHCTGVGLLGNWAYWEALAYSSISYRLASPLEAFYSALYN